MQGIPAKNPPKKAKKREAKRIRATKATIGRSSRQGCMRERERESGNLELRAHGKPYQIGQKESRGRTKKKKKTGNEE